MLNDHAVSANKPGDLVGCCESASVGFCEAKCEELSNMEVIREGFIVEPGKGWCAKIGGDVGIVCAHLVAVLCYRIYSPDGLTP